MKHWVSRLGLAALCSAIALPAGAATMASFTWDPQQMPETVGTPRDPGENVAAMGALVFFWARLAYAVIYLLGVPWLRTAAWFVSVIGMVMIACQLF